MLVDLTRDEHGCLHARLPDSVQGRSGKVYANWLTDQGVEVIVSVEHAALDAFHVVKLTGNALDEVRRRVQHATLGHRGHKVDPLYRIRRTLLTGVEHLTERQQAGAWTSISRSAIPTGRSSWPGRFIRRSARSTTPSHQPPVIDWRPRVSRSLVVRDRLVSMVLFALTGV